MLIDGEDVGTEDTAEVTSPWDGSVLGRVPVGTEADIDRAVAVALARHRAGPLHAHERAEILDRAAVSVSERIEDFARSICGEAAKPITTARTEAERCVDTLRFSAAVARTLTGETIPMDASSAGVGTLGFTMRIPAGVVGAISPFNFPLNLVAHKLAPAIAAGCPVVLKPASATPLTALLLARTLEECGLPPGWLNVVTCPGRVADHLVTHDDVAVVSFTGSAEVGWSIRERAPRKKVGLELGNNAPVIVHHDADLATAAAKVTKGGYSFAGQTCISVQRVYVHERVAEEFTDLLSTEVGGLSVGDPSLEETDVSALIDPGETDRVTSWIAEATDGGATLATGGSLHSNGVLGPTVLTRVTDDMRVCRSEVFGPLVGVQSYGDVARAFEAANDTAFGLQAGFFTGDLGLGLEAARRLDFGGVCINEVPTYRADQMPYGGVRDSGNTREGPAWSARELMTDERMVVIRTD